MNNMIRLALLACALVAGSVQAEWLDAVEVPWADHSDFRIMYYDKGRIEAQLICVAGAYDFLLSDIQLKKPQGLFAWMPRVDKVRFRIDDGEWHRHFTTNYYYNTKDSDRHERSVALRFTRDMMLRFMEGRKAEFVVLDTEDNTHRQTVSLIGFTRAFNTLPQPGDCI